ncbi:hypothetical protein V6N12_068965 [Hibiscus sabdariffa]|uniref:Uncharacterized protein n=1 Tax=Hibiscus sabdariffa TaxID=183260 RepID=A0ABR2CB65_9ROSI
MMFHPFLSITILNIHGAPPTPPFFRPSPPPCRRCFLRHLCHRELQIWLLSMRLPHQECTWTETEGRVFSKPAVDDAESTNAPTTPVDANTNVPMVTVIEPQLVAATAPLGTTLAMEPKLVAATISLAPNVATANTPQVASRIPNKVADTDSTNTPTTPVDDNTNVPMVAAIEPQSTVPFGSTMVPTTNSFGGPEGFIDFWLIR